MGEPARKFDHHPRPPARAPSAEGRRGRIVPMRRREAIEQGPQDWLLEQIVLWYRTRRD